MAATKENAKEIRDRLTSAKDYMRFAISELNMASELIEEEYQFAGNPALVKNTAGGLDVFALALLIEANRWNEYYYARKDN